MKKLILPVVALGLLFWAACSSPAKEEGSSETPELIVLDEVNKNIDEKGVGKFTNVTLTNPLNLDWVKEGEGIYNMKCLSCNKLADEKLVGPCNHFHHRL
ncbi:MAG: hypothetical protein D4R43_03085 [Sphingobacteriales bacterium]|nr:MAG: hypothetical protein D4R43_03085 [Sphingobacteriales bacterium]